MNTGIEIGEIMMITEKTILAIMIEITLMTGIATTITDKNKSRLWKTKAAFILQTEASNSRDTDLWYRTVRIVYYEELR